MKSKKKYSKIMKSGNLVIYKPTLEIVNIIDVHYDDPEGLYYTIRMPDSREKQTIGRNLKHNTKKSLKKF